jgi:ActR/RegA family two-component response regulator
MKILDVGQCGFDGPRLRRMLRERLEADVDCADTLDEALEQAAKYAYDLVLVNRVFNADRSSGLAAIAALHQAYPELKLMLVSDRPDAQMEAVALGACMGFGKSALGDEATVNLLCGCLAGN